MARDSGRYSILLHDIAIRDFDSHFHALNLAVPHGSRYALLAAPRAGKTSVVRLLAGLIQPNHGVGELLGMPLHRVHTLAPETVGFLHQHPNWAGSLTVADVLQLAAEHPQCEALASAAAFFDLQEALRFRIDRLSIGQRRRVGLALLQLRGTTLLILDDPIAGLAEDERQMMLRYIRLMSDGKTLFFTTSRLDDVQDLATHLGVLHEGTIIAEGSVPDVLAHPQASIYRVIIRGDASIVHANIVNLSWIHALDVTHDHESTQWLVAVTDTAENPTHLLRTILADRELQILQFSQVRPGIAHMLAQVQSLVSSPDSLD